MTGLFEIGIARLRPSEAGHTSASQITGSDRGRVIFSSAFRRLQRKAQVFPLDLNASVRTRLVHSIEVGHIGRYISETICAKAKDSRLEPLRKESNAFANIIETSCLLHDIGNPPFGHLGELGIREWFAQNFAKKKDEIDLISDFLNFDGNCQGFRIATKLQGRPGKRGLNLTTTQLASTVKYPVVIPRSSGIDDEEKYSVFETERYDFEQCWSDFGLHEGCRHPFSFLMEAADDIAYCLSDIEDAIEKGILTAELLGQLKNDLVDNNPDGALREIVQNWSINSNDLTWSLVDLRTKLINQLTDSAATLWLENIEKMKQGEIRELFSKKENQEGRFLSDIKKFARTYIFSSEEAINPELSGYRAIHILLDSFAPLLSMESEAARELLTEPERAGNTLEKRLALKLPEKYRAIYNESLTGNQRQCSEWVQRSHLICDYICGMTDIFALQTCHTFAAIKP